MVKDLANEDEDLLIDREILESHIKRSITADSDSPDLLAHLLIKIKRAIENRLQPVSQIIETLQVAIELTYLHTEAHSSAFKLYILCQQGRLLIQDYPVELINAAIDRSTADDESMHMTNNED